MTARFDPLQLSSADLLVALGILQTPNRRTADAYERLERPDLVIAPNGNPYIYRWHVTPRSDLANVYFHIQVADDPDRPLHDHPWDNTSVILAGGYAETIPAESWTDPISRQRRHNTKSHLRLPGDVIHRKATDAHHLRLAPGVAYSMSLFTTGPHQRLWGFHYPDGWRSYKDVTETRDGVSVHKESLP